MSDNRPTEWQWKTPEDVNRIITMLEAKLNETEKNLATVRELHRVEQWQWKTPEDGKIDGLSYNEWCERGVKAWASRQGGVIAQIRESLKSGMFNSAAWDHAPATLGGLPAAWPPRMDWQWRRLERDMDAMTWKAVAMWRYGGREKQPGAHCVANVAAETGEWWAPADEHGNPCEWPEVEPQPVVVIPAAEMTALVLYGHQAMGGAWRYRYRDDDDAEWSPEVHVWTMEDIREGEQWTPCDVHGDFCALRRVKEVLELDVMIQNAKDRVDDLWAKYDAKTELEKFAAQAVKLWDLGHGLGDVIEEMRRALTQKGGAP